jgi:hypothetical protein
MLAKISCNNIACDWYLAVVYLRLTRSAICGSKMLDSHKWLTVLVRQVKRKPRNFEANLCGSLYVNFLKSFQPYAFYNKLLQTLFIDQLVRSKAHLVHNYYLRFYITFM